MIIIIYLILNLYFALTRGRTRVPATPHYTLYCRTDRCRRPPLSGRRSRPRPPTPTIGDERRKMAGQAPVCVGGGGGVGGAVVRVRARAHLRPSVRVQLSIRPSPSLCVGRRTRRRCHIRYTMTVVSYGTRMKFRTRRAHVTDKII